MADTQGNQSLEGALTDAFAEATSGGSAPEAPPAETPSEAPEPADTAPEPAAAAPEPAAEEGGAAAGKVMAQRVAHQGQHAFYEGALQADGVGLAVREEAHDVRPVRDEGEAHLS